MDYTDHNESVAAAGTDTAGVQGCTYSAVDNATPPLTEIPFKPDTAAMRLPADSEPDTIASGLKALFDVVSEGVIGVDPEPRPRHPDAIDVESSEEES